MDINDQQGEIQKNMALINLTRVDVGYNHDMLHTLDMKLVAFNQTFTANIRSLQNITSGLISIAATQHYLSMFQTSFAQIQQDVDAVYEYLTTVSTHKVTPTLIPPQELWQVLAKVKQDMAPYPWLELPADPIENVWEYYEMIRIQPIVLDEYLVVTLEVPLVDKSLKLDIYQAHNLPVIHPQLKKAFQYRLESTFIGLIKDKKFVTLLSEADMIWCTLSWTKNCKIETALYLTDSCKWCVYALLVNWADLIEENCKINIITQTTNLAINLQDCHWAISALVSDRLFIQCLTETHYIDIQPPLQIIELPDSCEAHSKEILIPAYTEQSMTRELKPPKQRFLNLSEMHVDLMDLHLFQGPVFAKLSQIDLEAMSIELKPMENIPIEEIPVQLAQINKEYPYSMPQWLVILLSVVSTIIGLALILGIAYYHKYGVKLPKQKRKIQNVEIPLMMTKSEKPARPALESKDKNVDLEKGLRHVKVANTEVKPVVTKQRYVSVHNIHSLTSAKVRATPESIHRTLEMQGFDFSQVDRKLKQKRVETDNESETMF